MTDQQKKKIEKNLYAYKANFGYIEIAQYRGNKGFFVFTSAERKSKGDYTQYCYNIDYLNGWLYGCVQAVNGIMKPAKVHKEKVTVSLEKYERINRLLDLESLEEMSDEERIELGANTDVNENVFFVKFDDGSTLSYDLCSGSHNYFDDVVWKNADETRDIILDCSYCLEDIEFNVDDDYYIVELVVDGALKVVL